MKIAIQVADLDQARIDGTRVYILNLLKHFGRLDKESEFLLFHKKDFNPELAPPAFPNYKIFKKDFPFLWTQIRFAWEVWKEKPDVLWMPMAALPIIRRKKTKSVITIHDLAFKYFPQYFTKKDLYRLNLLADFSIRHSDGIIAISESTKNDILKFYPEIKKEKIKVIHHGFSSDIFGENRDLEKENNLKEELGIEGEYVLYSGAIQPRKNLERLIEAFDAYKNRSKSGIKLVLSGEKAWLWESVEKRAKESQFSADIIMPGKLRFCDIGHLFRGAKVFVYPSLYEGFGITILEAYAARIPLICASNSSLVEIGEKGALYFDANNASELSEQIEKVLSSEELQKELIAKGKERLKDFSWEKCARETLEFIKLKVKSS